jgi:catechol 2,3-dioxygenase-like lactoylglutathione lyase family enzyme
MDHIGINCADYPKSQLFYDTLLGVLGFSRQMDFGEAIGYGRDGKPEYHPGYFGAFVRDPDGNNVEAVCHHA